MKHRFKIIEYERGAQGVLYSVSFNDCTDCELDRFLNDDECSRHPEFGDVEAFLLDAVDRQGFQRRFFEQEKYRHDGPSLGYLSYYGLKRRDEHGGKKWLRIRLYCSWLSEKVVIAGMGCVKEIPGPLSQIAKCRNAFARIRLVDRIIAPKIIRKEIIITSTGIECDDDLIFEGEIND